MRTLSRKVKAARRRAIRRSLVRSFVKQAKIEVKTIKDLHETAEAFKKHCLTGSIIRSQSIAVAVAVSTLLLGLPQLIKQAEKILAKEQRKLK